MSLLCVPNFSEGRSERVVRRARGDPELARAPCSTPTSTPSTTAASSRSAASGEELAGAAVAGAEHAIELIDLRGHQGLHPHVGALDVCPFVWIHEDFRRAGAWRPPARRREGIADARDPGLPLRRARRRRGAPRARLLPPRRPRRAGQADGGRASWSPTSGRPSPHPSAGRDAGHGAPPAGRVQPRAGHAQPRDRAGGRRPAARGRRRPARGARARAAARGRARPGLGQRPRRRRGPARPRGRGGAAAGRRARGAAGRGRAGRAGAGGGDGGLPRRPRRSATSTPPST